MTNSSNVQDRQHAIRKRSIKKKQILKNGLEWNLTTKKNSGNYSYTSRSIYRRPKLSFKGQVAAKTPKGSIKSRLDKKN